MQHAQIASIKGNPIAPRVELPPMWLRESSDSVVIPPPSPGIADTFEGLDGSNLAGRIPDVTGDGPWTVPIGDFSIESNQAVCQDATGGNPWALGLIDCGLIDFAGGVTIQMPIPEDGGFVFRAVDEEDFYVVTFDGGGVQFSIYHYTTIGGIVPVAGPQIVVVDPTATNPFALTLTGTTVSVDFGGANLSSSTIDAASNRTLCGIASTHGASGTAFQDFSALPAP